MLRERLKRLVLGGSPATVSPAARESGLASAASGEAERARHSDCVARHSHGLEQFSSQLQEQPGLFILDLGGATQASVSFITSLGHKLYSEDLLRVLDGTFDRMHGDSAEEPSQALIEKFLHQNLDFPEAQFDGVLLWDALEFLPRPLLKAAIDRLFKIAKPDSYLLALFHADEKAASVPVYSYHISGANTLHLAHREMRHPVQLFNNRSVEKLFERFQSVKFFLTRDNLREVIVRR